MVVKCCLILILKKNDIVKLFPENGFLKDILLAWQKINKNKDQEFISQEIIWNNSNLKSDSKIFYSKKWIDRGITLIEHLFDYRRKTFYNFNDFKDLYQIDAGDFLLHTSILHSIPNKWKLILKTENIVIGKSSSTTIEIKTC